MAAVRMEQYGSSTSTQSEGLLHCCIAYAVMGSLQRKVAELATHHDTASRSHVQMMDVR